MRIDARRLDLEERQQIEFHSPDQAIRHDRRLMLELSGRCRVPHDSSATRRSGPLERMVRHLVCLLIGA